MRRFPSLSIALVTLVAVATLAGCDVGPQVSSQPGGPTTTPVAHTPTITPTTFPSPSIHTIAVPGYLVTQNSATAHGFVFDGWPNDGKPHPDGALYYYSYGTQTIKTVAVAQPDPTSGVLRDIHYVRAGGDVVAFLKADNNLAHWELDATNVVTSANYTLDSYTQEGLNGQGDFPGSLATDGARVAWSMITANVQGETTGHMLKVFDIATGMTRVIAHDATNGYLVAIHGDTVAWVQVPQDMTQAATVSVWRVSATGGTPTQVATTQAAVNVDVSDQYLVWDKYLDSSGEIIGIALNGGAKLPLNRAQCMRPLLAGNYLLCQDLGKGLLLVVDLRTGAAVSFAAREDLPYATVGGGRVVWWNSGNSRAEYITLPTN